MLDQKTCEVQHFTCAFEFLLGRSRCCLRSMDFAVASLRAATSARARTIAAAASSSCAFHCAMAAASAASFAASRANFSLSSACLQCQYQCKLIKMLKTRGMLAYRARASCAACLARAFASLRDIARSCFSSKPAVLVLLLRLPMPSIVSMQPPLLLPAAVPQPSPRNPDPHPRLPYYFSFLLLSLRRSSSTCPLYTGHLNYLFRIIVEIVELIAFTGDAADSKAS